MTSPSPWLACRVRRPYAPVRLFCFPHSGGSAGEYLRWADQLTDIEVWGVQTPGRGARTDEPPFTQMQPLVDALVNEASFAGPFAFFGHSLGALTAFEVARALRDLGREPPGWLFLSACPSPELPRRVAAPTSHLDDDRLLDALTHVYGTMVEDLREDAELRDLILPGLRADLAMVESYRYAPGAPLGCGMTLLGGAEDDTTRADLEPWRAHTSGPFDVQVFPGGHFYLREQGPRDALLRLLDDTLRQSLGPARAAW